MKPVAHGGNLDEIEQRFADAPRPWIDLSTGINPLAYPATNLAASSWARLPMKSDEQALLAVAAARYGVPDPATILAAPGTQALIQLLPRLVPRGRVAVVGPTYEEHEVCWRRQGHDVVVVPDLAQTADADVVVVVNPNNPTGRLLSPADLYDRRGLLVVDEAFIDFLAPTASLASHLPPHTIVLRSFGKAYGLAGVRLGFAIAEKSLIDRMRDELGPWAVSGPALDLGRRALGDEPWFQATAARLDAQRTKLDTLLVRAGFTLLGGTPLFRLTHHREAQSVVTRLAQHGIHVRAFAAGPNWLRWGIPGDDVALRRLKAALLGPAANESLSDATTLRF
jgi:cobalamin biosynthetic protein CobC